MVLSTLATTQGNHFLSPCYSRVSYFKILFSDFDEPTSRGVFYGENDRVKLEVRSAKSKNQILKWDTLPLQL